MNAIILEAKYGETWQHVALHIKDQNTNKLDHVSEIQLQNRISELKRLGVEAKTFEVSMHKTRCTQRYY